jgi:hypothetical protein
MPGGLRDVIGLVLLGCSTVACVTPLVVLDEKACVGIYVVSRPEAEGVAARFSVRGIGLALGIGYLAVGYQHFESTSIPLGCEGVFTASPSWTVWMGKPAEEQCTSSLP